MALTKIYNHISPGLSEMEKDMLKYIPPGGNWKNLPYHYNSKRLDQIRASGGRTTYYGRLLSNRPSYTITTYFHRLPNGCNIHPTQDRIISIREAARLQSFPDEYEFRSSVASQYKQIGNAVPPLLGRFIARQLKNQVENKVIFDLFSGAGGMSIGFEQEGFHLGGANEIIPSYFETFIFNNNDFQFNDGLILGDITQRDIKNRIISSGSKNDIGFVIGGPPCQGFSLAGWRDPSDDRNNLFKDFLEIVNELKPEVFIMENVPGILTMKNGAVIKEIIRSFTKIGYKVLQPILLKAEEYGVPQRRRRVIIIGSKKRKLKFDKSPIFSYDYNGLPDPINVNEAIGSLPRLGIKDGDSPISIDYIPHSVYEKYLAGMIEFDEFYSQAKLREKLGLPGQTSIF
jgi:DNA (cytosine-5)-methyltransferase 1